MTKGLSQVDRQLQNLGKQASDASRLFDGFAKSSGAAAAAQRQVATDIGFLTSAFKTEQLSAEEFAANLRDIVASAREQAAAFAEGARITEQTATAEERRAAQLERLGDLLQQGAIDAEVYGRAVASSTAGFDGTQAERFAQAIAPLQERVQAGSISFEEFSRQASGIADAVSGATSSSQRSAEAILALKQRLDAAAISIDEYRTQFAQIQAGNFSSQLSVEVLGIREGIDASEQLHAAIAGLQGTQIEAVLEVSGVESLDDLRARLDGIDGRQVDALLSVLGVDSVDAARQRLESLNATQVEAELRVIGFESIDAARSAVESLQDRSVTASLEFFGADAIDQVRDRIDSLDGITATAFLEATGFDSIEQAQDRLAALQDIDVKAVLGVLGADTIEDARQRLASLDGTEVFAQLQTAGFESIEQAQLLIDSLEGKDITVLAEALGVESVEQLTAVINAVESKTVTFDADTNADESAVAVAALVAEQREYQQLVQEASRLTQKYTSDEERRAAAIARIEQVNATGALSEQIYARAIEDASGAKEESARAAQEYASQQSRAAAIIEANLSAEERASRAYATAIAELDRLRDSGLLKEQDYAKAVERSAAAYAKATIAAAKYDDAASGSGDAGVLKFNELSGVLAAIPGPIGNVAGRLSGLASAGEGLGRVFSGGLSQGLASIGTSVAGLVNPFTAGLAAVAAFGAGATAVASSLVSLEDRVEKLGNAADKLGVSFEFIQIIEEAAARSGVSFEQVNSATTRLLKTLAGADEESKAATEALGRLGLSLGDLEGLSTQDQFEAIGQALTGIEDPAKRVAAATALFGKSGAELLPFFNNLGPAADDIERFGAALTKVDKRRIDDFGAGIDALGVATRALGQEVTLPFVELGEGVALAAAEFIGGVSRIASAIGDILAPEMNTLGNLFQALGQAASLAADVIVGAFRLVQQVLEPLGGSILPAVGAGIALINRQILVGAVANLAKFFTAAATAAVAYATSAGTAAISTAALGVSIRAAINSTGVGVLVTGFGLAAGALLEWAFASDEATTSIGGVTGAASGAADEVARLAEELAKEDEQNFQGIQRAISQAQQALNAAAGDAERFGEAGFRAAADFQAAIRELQEQADQGILNETALAQEVDNARQAYERQIETLEQLAKAEEDRAKAAQRAADAAIQADQRRADSFISSQQLGGEDPATKAAEDLLAITRQIEEAEAAIVAARAAGDAQAEQAALRRLATLDQAQAAASEVVQFGFSSGDLQRAIEEVRDNLDDTFSFDNFEIAPEAFAAAQEQLRELEGQLEARVIDPDTFAEAADAIRKGFEDALRTAEQIADLNERYAERVAEIDADRLDALSQVSQQPLQATDLRTSEGASQFLALATGRVDPAVEEYKKQLKELQKIETEIRKLGGVVDIVGAN